MPRPTRPALGLLLLTLLTSALYAPPAAAQDEPAAAAAPKTQDAPAVVGWLPDAYDSAIVIPNLGELDRGLASFESASGIGLGELQDAVGRFRRELGLMHGIDERGGMAVVVIEGGERPLAVMVLPVSDYDALAKSLGAEPDAVAQVTLPGGATGVLRKMDGFAVLGGNTQVVQAYAPAADADAAATRFGEMGMRALAGSHMALVMDTRRMDAAAATAQLTAHTMKLLGYADGVLAYDIDPAKRLPVLTSISGIVASGTDMAVVGMDFSAQGLGVTEGYTLGGSGGAMAELFRGPGTGANPADTLAKLPDRPVVFAAAGDPSAVGFAELADRLGGLLGFDARHALGTAKPVLQQLFDEADALATAYYAQPEPGLVASRWLNTVTVFETQDPDAFAELLEEAVNALNDAQLPVAGGEPITFETTYKPEDRLLGGVRYDTFTFKVHIPESLRNEPEMLALAVLGEIGFIGQAAVIDGHVVVTTFDDLGFITEAIDTVATGTGLGTRGELSDLRSSQLPQDAAMVGYLDLRGVAESLSPFLSVIGNADAVRIDAATEPIAFAISTGEGNALTRWFLPSSAALALVEEDFDPTVQRNDRDADDGRDDGRGLDNPGRIGPGRSNPGTRPGRSNPGRPDPGRNPGRTPGRGR